MKNLITTLVVAFGSLTAYADTSTLFIGNSFTYAYGSAAKFFRAARAAALVRLRDGADGGKQG